MLYICNKSNYYRKRSHKCKERCYYRKPHKKSSVEGGFCSEYYGNIKMVSIETEVIYNIFKEIMWRVFNGS